MALALLPLNLVLEAWKWHTLLRRAMPTPPRFGEAFGAMMSGYALGLFTPARVGDYAGRAFYLKHHDKWELAALTLADRLIALSCYVFFGWLALMYYLLAHLHMPGWVTQLVWFTGILGVGALLFVMVHPRFAYDALVTILPISSFRRMLRFLNRLASRDVFVLLGQSTLRFAVFSTQFVCLVWAFDPALDMRHAYVGVALVFFTQTVVPSVTLMDLGIREGAAVFFLGAFGVMEAAAFDAAFMLFCINLLLPAFTGIPFLMRLRLETPPEPSTAHRTA